MATVTISQKAKKNKDNWQKIGRIAAFVSVAALSIAIVIWGDQLENLPVYGYPAIFLVSLLGNLSVIFPAPSYLVVFAASSTLDPLAVGVIAGLGATLGELTGYVAGASGKGVVEDRPIYQRVKAAIEKWGMWIIFLLGVIPNFFFDIGGMVAGATRMPLWRFILAAWLGKSIRLTIVAMTGSAWL
ncbi:MAG: VTT domain-containing protein [Chloroflexota bacterium]|jgi:membrane protein YqaA with SNARE-associated domain